MTHHPHDLIIDGWLRCVQRHIRHDGVRAACRTAILAPSMPERIAAYSAALSLREHPSETASRAARGLAIQRRIAWIERAKRNHVAGARPAVCCLHAAGSRHLPTSRAPGTGQGALIHVGLEYARAETLAGRHPTTDICET